jgi:hypothetical protein
LVAELGVSTLTPAFPAISREFGISGGQVGLLITVFTLPGVVLTPMLGVLSDHQGRRKIRVPALLLFGAAGGLRLCPRLPAPAGLAGFSGGGGRGAGCLERDGDRGHLRRTRTPVGPGPQPQRPLRGHRELPGRRRQAGFVRLILPVRAAVGPHPHGRVRALLAAQPKTAERTGPQEVLRARVGAPARQGGARRHRGLRHGPCHRVWHTTFLLADPDERPLRRPSTLGCVSKGTEPAADYYLLAPTLPDNPT